MPIGWSSFPRVSQDHQHDGAIAARRTSPQGQENRSSLSLAICHSFGAQRFRQSITDRPLWGEVKVDVGRSGYRTAGDVQGSGCRQETRRRSTEECPHEMRKDACDKSAAEKKIADAAKQPLQEVRNRRRRLITIRLYFRLPRPHKRSSTTTRGPSRPQYDAADPGRRDDAGARPCRIAAA
jgi:hypothetical protein